MLDNCSTGSYVSEAVAEELMLQGKSEQLTISGTGGSEVKKSSRQVEGTVASVDNKFSASLQANVLDNIAGDTPPFEWSTLKTNLSHLQSIPFQKVAKRSIDVLIGSDNPIFHQLLQETIDNSMYADDILDSCETVNEAVQLRDELSELLELGKFKLRKWSSNDPAVLNDVPVEDRLQSLEIPEAEDTPKIKSLGVLWEAMADVFTSLFKHQM